MEWIRGDRIGHGSFGSVHLAIPTNQNSQFHRLNQLMAVKSAPVFSSESLENERDVLNRLSGNCNVIKCFGYDRRFENNGEETCNLLLEYASGGSLADKVKKSGNGLPEFEIRGYLKSIVEGVKYVHENGFVHCDVKIQNLLLDCENTVKIADFGLAKKRNSGEKTEFRGTPLNMSPESVNGGEYEAPADIWAIGCAVVEMLTGKPAWKCEPGSYMGSLLLRIGIGEELPEIPENLSENGKDFLRKCFVKDPRKRWTAEMLLDHPFITLNNEDLFGEINDNSLSLKIKYEEPSISPRCPFYFPDSPESGINFAGELGLWLESCDCLGGNRIRQLETVGRSDWSDLDRWIIVR